MNFRNTIFYPLAKRLTISFIGFFLGAVLLSYNTSLAMLSEDRQIIRSMVVEEALELGLPVALALAVLTLRHYGDLELILDWASTFF